MRKCITFYNLHKLKMAWALINLVNLDQFSRGPYFATKQSKCLRSCILSFLMGTTPQPNLEQIRDVGYQI